MRRFSSAFLTVTALIGLLLFWHLLAASGILSPTLIASPQEAAMRFWQGFDPAASNYDQLHRHAAATFLRALEGWGLAIVVGTIGGLILNISRWMYGASQPAIEFIRAVPPILAFPLLLVAFNYGMGAYIWTITFGCVPIMVLTVAQGIRARPAERYSVFRLHQRRLSNRLFVSIMELVPTIFLGARVTFSFALIIAVVTEMVFTPRSGFGIGSIAKDAEISFDTPTFYAAVVLIGIIGFLGNLILQHFENRLRSDEHK